MLYVGGEEDWKCQAYSFLVPLDHQEAAIFFIMVAFSQGCLYLGFDYLPPSTHSPLPYTPSLPIMIRFLLKVRQYISLSCDITCLKQTNVECFKKDTVVSWLAGDPCMGRQIAAFQVGQIQAIYKLPSLGQVIGTLRDSVFSFRLEDQKQYMQISGIYRIREKIALIFRSRMEKGKTEGER